MLEMLLFGLLSALVVILLMPADVQASIRRALVSAARRFADVIESGHARAASRPVTESSKEGITKKNPWSEPKVVSVEKVVDVDALERRFAMIQDQLDASQNRFQSFLYNYHGDMARVGDKLQEVDGLDRQLDSTHSSIEYLRSLDRKLELRVIAIEELLQSPRELKEALEKVEDQATQLRKEIERQNAITEQLKKFEY